MSPERFRRIEKLYHAAQEGSAGERAVLLASLDPDVRSEVESLLADGTGGSFLERPAIHNAAEAAGDATVTTLSSGACLGPYRIEAKLGEGGMGEVFRAIDTRLGRAVAIKTAHQQFTERFEREARAISALNHPHICTLHDVGPNYIVMELVEGETIAGRLKRGPLPVETVRLYGSQIAAALAEAHSKGIVHRDLKPGNIMIAKSGVKVLDFGLAKSGADETVTGSHMVVGTPAYMSPEQREGKPADARSDIYSFGCVLYEMLTGARAISERKRIPSRKLEEVVRRCLELDPARRWQSTAELERELAPAPARARPWHAIVAAGVAVLALGAAGYLYFHRAPKLTATDTIVLADFANKTGDPVFDDALRQGLTVELQQSPFLSLLSDQRIQQTLALMGQAKDARLSPELAQQVCERTASAAILEGSIASLGSQYVVGLRAKSCTTGNILDQEQIQAARREDVLNSLSQIARKFRARVGESLATVEQHSTPLAEATTSSLEALKAYSRGMKLHYSGGSVVGIPFFRRAIDIDPQFAMAYANLSISYSDIGESVLSAEATLKAWQLRKRTSERERYFIDFLYDRQVTGNLEKAYQTLEAWYRTYPQDGEPPTPQNLLGGIASHGTGRFERAMEAAQKEIAGHPDIALGYQGLAFSYLFLDRFPESAAVLQRALDRKLGSPNLLLLRYNVAMMQGDQAQMDRLAALAKGKQGAEHRMAHLEALGLARSGHIQAAAQLSRRAVDLAIQEGELEAAASYQSARAVWEALYGNAAAGKAAAMAANDLSKGRDVQYAAALALAFSGDSSASEAVAGELEKRFPEDTFVKFTYAPVLRAEAALTRGKPAESVERLQIALPYELWANGLNHGHFYLGGLHSAYVRGEAFLALRQYADAVAEFQKILNHRGIVVGDPIGALAHWRLGRVYGLSGDIPKARSAYEAFFTLWKDADREIPGLKQARAEYAALK